MNIIKPVSALIALGGFVTAAAAQTSVASQSSVTIYGLVDLSAQYLRSGDRSPMAGSNMWRLADGILYGPGSRWGIRGTEDLGGGLTAKVLLESGFSADTGVSTQGGRLFGRQSYVAVSSASAGEIRLGRQYILHDELLPVSSPVGGVTVSNPYAVYTVAAGAFNTIIDAPRIDNAVHYLSPTFGGFQLQGMIAPGEGTQDLYRGIKLNYRSGPFTSALAYERSKARVTPAGGNSNVNNVFGIGANYDFVSFKLYGGYQNARDLTTGVGTQIGTLTLPTMTGAATDLKAFTVGASTPVGAATLAANYERSKFSNAAGASVSVGRLGFGADYSLSKLTSLYGYVAFATGGLRDYVNEKQIYQLGLRKAF